MSERTAFKAATYVVLALSLLYIVVPILDRHWGELPTAPYVCFAVAAGALLVAANQGKP